MLDAIKSEWLKTKRTFNRKMLVLAPLITVLLGALLYPQKVAELAFNWWYLFIIPASLAIFTASICCTDKKKNRHGLLAVVTEKKKLMLSKLFVSLGFLFAILTVFFVFVIITECLAGVLSVIPALLGSLVLFVSFAWQIPVMIWFSEISNVTLTVFASFILNCGSAMFIADKSYWWIPFAIPARIVTPIIKVMPNGCSLPVGNYLGDSSVILPGLLITAALFIVSSFAVYLWYQKREV